MGMFMDVTNGRVMLGSDTIKRFLVFDIKQSQEYLLLSYIVMESFTYIY